MSPIDFHDPVWETWLFFHWYIFCPTLYPQQNSKDETLESGHHLLSMQDEFITTIVLYSSVHHTCLAHASYVDPTKWNVSYWAWTVAVNTMRMLKWISKMNFIPVRICDYVPWHPRYRLRFQKTVSPPMSTNATGFKFELDELGQLFHMNVL